MLIACAFWLSHFVIAHNISTAYCSSLGNNVNLLSETITNCNNTVVANSFQLIKSWSVNSHRRLMKTKRRQRCHKQKEHDYQFCDIHLPYLPVTVGRLLTDRISGKLFFTFTLL